MCLLSGFTASGGGVDVGAGVVMIIILTTVYMLPLSTRMGINIRNKVGLSRCLISNSSKCGTRRMNKVGPNFRLKIAISCRVKGR